MVAIRSLLVLVALVGVAAPAAARPLVAVLDFSESRTGLHKEELAVLGDVSRGEALRSLGHAYDVITRENLIDLLKSHGKSLAKCSGECETETGRLLGAELVVSGRVVKAFGKFKVNLKVHRTDPPSLLGAEMMTASEPEDLERAVREGTAKVLAAVPGARDSSPSAPPSARVQPASRSSRSITKDIVRGVVRAAGKSAERSLAAGAASAEAASRAVTGLAQQAQELHAQAQSLAMEWSELDRLARNDDLSKDQRIHAVKLFLERAPKGSGYHQKATELLEELTQGPAWYGARTEWFSIGYAYGAALGGGHGGFMGLPTLKWGAFYWQTLEYVGLSLTSTYGAEYDQGSYLQSVASIVGYRQTLTPDGRHDLRLGLGVSWLGLEDDASCDDWQQQCDDPNANGYYDRDFIGMGLVPEVGWIWHMSPGTSLVTKLRYFLPVGDGYSSGYCYPDGGCPWPDGDSDSSAVQEDGADSSAVLSVGLGW